MAAYHCEEVGSITQELHTGENPCVCACTCAHAHVCPQAKDDPEAVRSERNAPCGCLQDFGEYQESYYSVQTTEGEQISQLIAGYIDIILKKVTHSSPDMVGAEGQYLFLHHPPHGLSSHSHQSAPSSSCITTCVFFCFLQKQSKDRFGLEGDEESTMLEESVSPKKCVHE